MDSLLIIALVAILAFLATYLGGMFALKFRDKLHLILGFSAGAVIAVAFFDLIPEALELAGTSYDVSFIMPVIALGFFLYMIIDRFISPHTHDDDCDKHDHRKGRLGAGSLSVHSFLDGLAVGLAFQASFAIGIVVTIAVLVHDFSDGINTVGLILRNGGNKKEAMKWLLADSIAPVIGIIVGSLITLSDAGLGLLLALFAGFFLYIGASDLLPESHHNHPTLWTTAMTILGALVLYGAIQIAGV